MWHQLTDWLPTVHVGSFELRDIVSLIVAGVGAYLAWLAIKLGRSQAKIAALQHEMLRQQFYAQALLKIDLTSIETSETKPCYSVQVKNTGASVINSYVLWTDERVEPDLKIEVFFIQHDSNVPAGTTRSEVGALTKRGERTEARITCQGKTLNPGNRAELFYRFSGRDGRIHPAPGLRTGRHMVRVWVEADYDLFTKKFDLHSEFKSMKRWNFDDTEQVDSFTAKTIIFGNP
jgi:hypothetical protein